MMNENSRSLHVVLLLIFAVVITILALKGGAPQEALSTDGSAQSATATPAAAVEPGSTPPAAEQPAAPVETPAANNSPESWK